MEDKTELNRPKVKKFKTIIVISIMLAALIALFIFFNKGEVTKDIGIIKEKFIQENQESLAPLATQFIENNSNQDGINQLNCANFVELFTEALEMKYLLRLGNDFSMPLARISLLFNNKEGLKLIEQLRNYGASNRLNINILKNEFNENVNNLIASYNYDHSENKFFEKIKFYLSKVISVRKIGLNAKNDSGIEEVILHINEELDLGNIEKAKELLENIKDLHSVHATMWINKANSFIEANNNVSQLIDLIKLHNQCGK